MSCDTHVANAMQILRREGIPASAIERENHPNENMPSIIISALCKNAKMSYEQVGMLSHYLRIKEITLNDIFENKHVKPSSLENFFEEHMSKEDHTVSELSSLFETANLKNPNFKSGLVVARTFKKYVHKNFERLHTTARRNDTSYMNIVSAIDNVCEKINDDNPVLYQCLDIMDELSEYAEESKDLPNEQCQQIFDCFHKIDDKIKNRKQNVLISDAIYSD